MMTVTVLEMSLLILLCSYSIDSIKMMNGLKSGIQVICQVIAIAMCGGYD